MKKSISLLVIFSLFISLFVLVGCAKEKNEEGKERKLSVAIVVSSGFGDNSFNDSAKEGGERLKKELGVDVQYIECNNADYKQKLTTAAETSEIVIPVGWEFADGITDVADESRKDEVKFIWIDNFVDAVENHPNIMCITYSQNEGSFLVGYIASKLSKTGTIGAVGGEDVPTVNDFISGYEQGAKYAREDINIVKNYSDSYEDAAKGKKCAEELNEQGADVIFQVAGNSGIGVYEAALERGFHAVGVNQDQKLTSPKYDNVVLCSMVKSIGNSIYDTIKSYMKNCEWKGGSIWNANMATGHISVVYGDEGSNKIVSDELINEVEEIRKKIISGEIVVNSNVG